MRTFFLIVCVATASAAPNADADADPALLYSGYHYPYANHPYAASPYYPGYPVVPKVVKIEEPAMAKMRGAEEVAAVPAAQPFATFPYNFGDNYPFARAAVGQYPYAFGHQQAFLPTTQAVLPTTQAVIPTTHTVIPTAQAVVPTAHTVVPTTHTVVPTAHTVGVAAHPFNGITADGRHVANSVGAVHIVKREAEADADADADAYYGYGGYYGARAYGYSPYGYAGYRGYGFGGYRGYGLGYRRFGYGYQW